MKHKTKRQRINWFKKYESDTFDWEKYFKTVGFNENHSTKQKGKTIKSVKRKSARSRFIKKYNEWKLLDNRFMEKKTKNKKQKRDYEKIIDQLPENVKREIIKEYLKEQEKKKKSERMKDASNRKWTYFVKALVFNLSESGIKNNVHNAKKYKVLGVLDISILGVAYAKSMRNLDGKFIAFIAGRKPIHQDLIEKGITVSERHVGRRMALLGCTSQVQPKKPKRRKEQKNTDTEIDNIANRDYDNHLVISQDTTYINKKTSRSNHLYCEIAINWGTTFVTGYDLSLSPDQNMVDKVFAKNKMQPGMIFHSDSGSLYLTKSFRDNLQGFGVQQSKSRIGNSLDNRPSEFFFKLLKNECLKFFDLKLLTIEEIKLLINKYIKYYNHERKQEKLGWKTPAQALMSISPNYSSLLFTS